MSDQWIPVTERLPKWGQFVIVAYNVACGPPDREVGAECHYADGGWTGSNKMAGGEPTHWMPLPEPPAKVTLYAAERDMIDASKRCMHCVFYDDFGSQCQAHPPAYAGRFKDEYGDNVTGYSQPIIELEWAETCGEWQDGHPGKTADERMAEIVHAAELDKRARQSKAL